MTTLSQVKSCEILLVEDNPADAELVEIALENTSWITSFKWVSSIDEAEKYFENQYPDVVLLDLNLPDGSGRDFAEKLLKCSKKLPIIILTGVSDPEEGLDTIALGVQDFIPKNEMNRSSLLRSIRYAIERIDLQTEVDSERSNLKQLVRDCPFGILVIDLVGSLYFHNESVTTLLGEKTSLELFVKETDFNSREIMCQTDNGSRYFSIHKQNILWDGKQATLVIMFDVTDLKNMKARILNNFKVEAIGTLSGGIAHEINNPLMIMLNYAEMIMENTIDSDPKSYEFAREILTETKAISKIIQNLLRFSRNEENGGSYENMNELVLKTLSLVESNLKRDCIQIELDLDKTLIECHCAGSIIQQVLMSMLDNARDSLNEKYPGYSKDKKLKISSAQFKENGTNWVKISIKDDGLGLDEEAIKRVFDPFFTTKRPARGKGIGLATSYRMIKEHKGDILVESKKGEFAYFSIVIPEHNVAEN